MGWRDCSLIGFTDIRNDRCSLSCNLRRLRKFQASTGMTSGADALARGDAHIKRAGMVVGKFQMNP